MQDNNSKTWVYTTWVMVLILGFFVLSHLPNTNELDSINKEIQTLNQKIDNRKSTATSNSPYKDDFNVIQAENKIQTKLIKIVSSIYNKRSIDDEAMQMKKWKKELKGKAGADFLKHYGDSYGYTSNKSTQVYFGDVKDLEHVKVYVITIAESDSKKESTYSWTMDYNLRADKLNSFNEVSVRRD